MPERTNFFFLRALSKPSMEKNIQQLQSLLQRAQDQGLVDEALRLEGALDFAIKMDEKYVMVSREQRQKEKEWKQRVVRILESFVQEST